MSFRVSLYFGTFDQFFFQVNKGYIYQNGQARIINTPSSLYRYLHCTAFHPLNDDIVFLFGGQSGGNYYNTVFQFNLNDLTFASKKSLPVATLNKHSCASYLTDNGDAKIMITGGTSNNGLSFSVKVWNYDIATNTYQTRDDLPYHLRGHFMVPFQGYMYVFNGYKKPGDGPSDAVHRIDLNDVGASWETLDQPTTHQISNWLFPFNYDYEAENV